jgi:surfeit locus 1 family protein
MIRPSLFQQTLIITLLVLCGVTLLCSLGFWQLSRAEQKEAILLNFENNAAERALGAKELISQTSPISLRYYGVKLHGHFFNDHNILLDNKTNDGQIGYHVLTPFTLDDHTLILINRGFIPIGRSRAILPVISPIMGEVTIEGYLDFAYRNPFIKGSLETHSIEWPLRVQAVDLNLLQNLIGKKIYTMLVTLHSDSAFAFVPPKQPSSWMTPSKHRGYAVQWFSLAATLLAYTGYCLIRRKSKS